MPPVRCRRLCQIARPDPVRASAGTAARVWTCGLRLSVTVRPRQPPETRPGSAQTATYGPRACRRITGGCVRRNSTVPFRPLPSPSCCKPALNLLSFTLSASVEDDVAAWRICIDYVFAAPVGSNLQYSELAFISESWLKVFTSGEQESWCVIEDYTRRMREYLLGYPYGE